MEGQVENKSPSVATKVRQFCERSTVHGLSFAARAEEKPIRVLWSTIVFLGTMGMAYHLYEITNAYLEYKTTEYLYEDLNGYYFPDVTLCNLNGISFTNMQELAKSNENVENILVSFYPGNNKTAKLPPLDDIFWGLGEEATKLGQRHQDFILECKYAGAPCSEDDFVLVQLDTFYNCFTFTQRSYPKTAKQGLTSGLQLILYTEPYPKEFRKPYASRSSVLNNDGVRIQVSSQNALPAVISKGYDLVPGHDTTIRFSISEQRRLPLPYSRCRTVKIENITYTFTECRNRCIHQEVISKCGCYPTVYSSRANYTAKGIVSCGYHLFSNESLATQMMDCQTQVLEDIEMYLDYERDCDCHLPCQEFEYPLSMSHSLWPSDTTMESFIDTMMESNTQGQHFKNYYSDLKQQNASIEVIEHWVRKSFLKLTIFAPTKTVSVKEQIPKITLIDVFSQIGGCLGTVARNFYCNLCRIHPSYCLVCFSLSFRRLL